VLSNKRFKLTKPALALDVVVRQGWITIPAGEIIRVLAGPNGEGNKMIDVLWEGRMLTMFAIDVTVGCKAIRAGSATRSISSGAVNAPVRQSQDRLRKQH
jgi:hypothetical protein